MTDDKIKILVVEDDALLRSLFVRILRKNGYETFEASSGQEALNLCTMQSSLQKIDLIYSDVRMPDGDGLELLAELKTLSLLPKYFVFITGHADLSREETKILGAYDILEKPIEMSFFLNYTKKLFLV